MPWIVIGGLFALIYAVTRSSRVLPAVVTPEDHGVPATPVNPVVPAGKTLAELRKLAISKAREVTSTTDIGLIVHITQAGTVGFLTYQAPEQMPTLQDDFKAIQDFDRLTRAGTHYVARFRRQNAGIDLVQQSMDGRLT